MNTVTQQAIKEWESALQATFRKIKEAESKFEAVETRDTDITQGYLHELLNALSELNELSGMAIDFQVEADYAYRAAYAQAFSTALNKRKDGKATMRQIEQEAEDATNDERRIKEAISAAREKMKGWDKVVTERLYAIKHLSGKPHYM